MRIVLLGMHGRLLELKENKAPYAGRYGYDMMMRYDATSRVVLCTKAAA